MSSSWSLLCLQNHATFIRISSRVVINHEKSAKKCKK